MADHQESTIAGRDGLDAERPARSMSLVRAEMQVVGLAVAIAAATLAVYRLTPDRGEAVIGAPWWVFVFAAVMFGVAEYTVINVHFLRQGISFTLSDLPMAIALAFLTPGLSLLARFPLALGVLLLVRRNQPHKLAFNVALILFEMAAATLIVRRLLALAPESRTLLLVAIAVSLVVVMPMGTVIISMAISRFEGRFWRRVRDELAATWWLYPINIVVAVMTVALMFVNPWLGLGALLPVAAVWYVLHSYGQLNQELRDLDLAHGFAGRVGRSLDVDQIAQTAVVELTEAFRAQGAALVGVGEHAGLQTRHGAIGVRLPTADGDTNWARLFGDEPRLVTPSEAAVVGVAMDPDLPAMLVARVADEAGTVALLVVCQAPKYVNTFGRADVARLRNMVQQLVVSLRRGVLHERLEYEARHDALTGLPSRRLFEQVVGEAIAHRTDAPDEDRVTAVMMLDLDRFKEVNDTLGHHAGDALLIEFSRRISLLLGPDDQLARLAGDEFAILVRRRSRAALAALADRIGRTAGEPVVLDGIEIVVTVSVGVAEITDFDLIATDAMRRADIAMYNAKWQRTGVEIYRDDIDRRTPARLSMLGDLRAAIEADELSLVYQPKVDLAAGSVVGAEALVRWKHAKRGLIAPAEFIRVAEDTGLIKELTDTVLTQAIADLRLLEREGLGLAVNVSTRDLFDVRLPERVTSKLERNGVQPSSLTLEITESSLLVDVPRTRATIDELHAAGLCLTVDDFGTGYSSLSYLRRLPVRELKIDQSFVLGMEHDPQDEVIVRSTVDLAHNLGLVVVAEGVENQFLLNRLKAMGCDIAQGYEISRPMPLDDLIAWVRRVRATPGWLLPTRAVG